jgi:tight adherence protein B
MTGLTVAALAVAVGLVRRPSPVTTRLRALQRRPQWVSFRGPMLPRTRAGTPVAALCGAAVLGAWAWLDYGVAVPLLPAVAGAVAGATVAAVLSRMAADRARRHADTVLAGAIGGLAADLRAGQQPAEALAALGPGEATRHRSVVAVWSVSQRSGAPAAAVLDRVEQDLRARQAQRREVAAALAGARSTGALLAVLPLLGIGLGAGMGARPLSVLLAQPRGELALAVGVALEAVGVLWTSRIVAAAEGVR